MKRYARSARLVPGLAVAAVSIAAVATAASSWLERQESAAPAAIQAQRPAADEPVNVVKAPPLRAAIQQPVGCRDCGNERAQEQRL